MGRPLVFTGASSPRRGIHLGDLSENLLRLAGEMANLQGFRVTRKADRSLPYRQSIVSRIFLNQVLQGEAVSAAAGQFLAALQNHNILATVDWD